MKWSNTWQTNKSLISGPGVFIKDVLTGDLDKELFKVASQARTGLRVNFTQALPAVYLGWIIFVMLHGNCSVKNTSDLCCGNGMYRHVLLMLFFSQSFLFCLVYWHAGLLWNNEVKSGIFSTHQKQTKVLFKNGFIRSIDVTHPESLTGSKITWIIKARGHACFMFNWTSLQQRCYVDLFHRDPFDILWRTWAVNEKQTESSRSDLIRHARIIHAHFSLVIQQPIGGRRGVVVLRHKSFLSSGFSEL